MSKSGSIGVNAALRSDDGRDCPSSDSPLPIPDSRLYIAGIDEAGRGPLAGPVVVAAVVFLAIPRVGFGFFFEAISFLSSSTWASRDGRG